MIAIFAFYEVANGVQSFLSFSRIFQHCNVITFDGDIWLNVDFDRFGIHTRRLKVKSGARLCNALKSMPILTALVVVDIAEPVGICWKPWWVRSCNELCRYLTGVDIGFTFNPAHLYKKLLKYDQSNYTVLNAWRRDYGDVRVII